MEGYSVAHIYIIRGVPGSGKTTLAGSMKAAGMVDYVFEADVFMVDDAGEYLFDPSRLKYCHGKCQEVTDSAISMGYNIAVSNTFTRKWEVQPYLDMAEKHGAQVTVIVCQGDYGNVHGVPEVKVSEMKRRFEY